MFRLITDNVTLRSPISFWNSYAISVITFWPKLKYLVWNLLITTSKSGSVSLGQFWADIVWKCLCCWKKVVINSSGIWMNEIEKRWYRDGKLNHEKLYFVWNLCAQVAVQIDTNKLEFIFVINASVIFDQKSRVSYRKRPQ